jgi:hypothetical protein
MIVAYIDIVAERTPWRCNSSLDFLLARRLNASLASWVRAGLGAWSCFTAARTNQVLLVVVTVHMEHGDADVMQMAAKHDLDVVATSCLCCGAIACARSVADTMRDQNDFARAHSLTFHIVQTCMHWIPSITLSLCLRGLTYVFCDQSVWWRLLSWQWIVC